MAEGKNTTKIEVVIKDWGYFHPCPFKRRGTYVIDGVKIKVKTITCDYNEAGLACWIIEGD